LFRVQRTHSPALVEAALQTGKGAALNVLNDIRGKEREEIKPKLHGVMVSVEVSLPLLRLWGSASKVFGNINEIPRKYTLFVWNRRF